MSAAPGVGNISSYIIQFFIRYVFLFLPGFTSACMFVVCCLLRGNHLCMPCKHDVKNVKVVEPKLPRFFPTLEGRGTWSIPTDVRTGLSRHGPPPLPGPNIQARPPFFHAWSDDGHLGSQKKPPPGGGHRKKFKLLKKDRNLNSQPSSSPFLFS